jgi:hypothetical protein
VLSQLHLTHSASVEFLRQFWLSYFSSPNNSTIKKKELETLTQSLKRTLDRMEAVRMYAVKEGGDIMGNRVAEILASVAGSIRKAIGLWEKSG